MSCGSVHLFSHPDGVLQRGVIQGQQQDFGVGRQIFQKVRQGLAPRPQTLQIGGFISERVDDECAPRVVLRRRTVNKHSVQSLHLESWSRIARFKPLQTFSGPSSVSGATCILQSRRVYELQVIGRSRISRRKRSAEM